MTPSLLVRGSSSMRIVVTSHRMMAGALMTPSLHRRAQHSTRTWGDARIPLAIGDPGEGMEHLWSPAGATGGNRWQMEHPKNRSNKPIRNRWQPTATVSERMVRRGSTVRVRQRALQKRRTSAPLRSERLALDPACVGYGAVYGAFALRTWLGRAVCEGSAGRLRRQPARRRFGGRRDDWLSSRRRAIVGRPTNRPGGA
jgi:hypothetical protein